MVMMYGSRISRRGFIARRIDSGSSSSSLEQDDARHLAAARRRHQIHGQLQQKRGQGRRGLSLQKQ
jgi:hypothetical protein